jgi:hypothetical protein
LRCGPGRAGPERLPLSRPRFFAPSPEIRLAHVRRSNRAAAKAACETFKKTTYTHSRRLPVRIYSKLCCFGDSTSGQHCLHLFINPVLNYCRCSKRLAHVVRKYRQEVETFRERLDAIITGFAKSKNNRILIDTTGSHSFNKPVTNAETRIQYNGQRRAESVGRIGALS